jgi:hypothetical protein
MLERPVRSPLARDPNKVDLLNRELLVLLKEESLVLPLVQQICKFNIAIICTF